MNVSAAFVTHNNRILLFLRDNKPGLSNPNKWSLIGGHVEKGETFEQGLLREIREEISIEIDIYRFLFEYKDFYGEDVKFYHVPLSDKEISLVKLGDEGQEVKFFSFEELEKLPLTENLLDLLNRNKALIRNLIKK